MAKPTTTYPLSAGSLFRIGWSIFRFAWRSMLLAAAVFLVPAFTLSTAVSLLFETRLSEYLAEWTRAVQDNFPAPPEPPNFGIGIVALLTAAIVAFVCSFLAGAAIVGIVDRVYRGEHVSAGRSVRFALTRLPSLCVGELLYVLACLAIVLVGVSCAALLFVGGGLLVFIAMLVFFGTVAALVFVVVRSALLVQGVVVDRLGGAEALARSWRLVHGSGWQVLGYLIAIALLSSAASLVFGGLPSSLVEAAGNETVDVVVKTVLSSAISLVLAPFAPIVLTLLYFDLRWRHGERVPLPGGGETGGGETGSRETAPPLERA